MFDTVTQTSSVSSITEWTLLMFGQRMIDVYSMTHVQYSVHTPATLSERRSQRSLCDKTGMSQTFWDFKGLPGENTICGTDGSYNSYFLDTVRYHILYQYPKIMIYGS